MTTEMKDECCLKKLLLADTIFIYIWNAVERYTRQRNETALVFFS